MGPNQSSQTGIMKILKGSLVEDLYDWPIPEVITAPHDATPKSTMTLRETTTLSENDVAYMSDKVCSLQAQRHSDPGIMPLTSQAHALDRGGACGSIMATHL